MMNILTLDLGTRTGWALLQKNGLGDSQQHSVGADDKADHLAGSDITQQNGAWKGSKVDYLADTDNNTGYLVNSGTIIMV